MTKEIALHERDMENTSNGQLEVRVGHKSKSDSYWLISESFLLNVWALLNAHCLIEV